MMISVFPSLDDAVERYDSTRIQCLCCVVSMRNWSDLIRYWLLREVSGSVLTLSALSFNFSKSEGVAYNPCSCARFPYFLIR